jgi:hypothetical protein
MGQGVNAATAVVVAAAKRWLATFTAGKVNAEFLAAHTAMTAAPVSTPPVRADNRS